MRRSQRNLLFVLLAALVVALALPLTAAAGEQDPSEAVFGGEGPPSTQALEGGSSSGSGSNAGSDDASISQSSDSGSGNSGSGNSSRGDRNCSDFSSHENAQSTYVNQDGDPDNLDADNDGEACEEFDYGDEEDFDEVEFDDASVDEYPREGIASGGGSTAAGGLSPLPLLIGAGAFALLAAGSGAFTLRRPLGR
jgi:hypothetical protein